MRHTIRYVIATLVLAASAFAGVTVSSPAQGAASGSPVHFVASASSTAPITAMRVYVDYVSVYTNSTNSIDTFIPMPVGVHNIIVQAWDTTGAVFKIPETITVTAPAVGVTVSSPANNATVGSPVRVVASATAGNPIAAMRIYLDGVSAYTVNAASLDTQVAAAAGMHSMVVQAWDITGAVYKQALTISVTGSSDPPPAVIPSNATAKTEIQAMPNWGSCTVCAGINASGPVAIYSMIQNQLTPSLSGNSTKFSSSGPSWADVIWWHELGAADAATHFQYDIDFYLEQPQNAFALEFDVNQTVNSTRFVFGTQCGINYDHQWDVWDTAGGHWKPTGVPCAIPSAFQWHHITWEFYRDASTIHFVAVTVDGMRHYINVAYSASPWSNSPELNVAFQMDGDSVMHAYSVWLDNVKLTYW